MPGSSDERLAPDCGRKLRRLKAENRLLRRARKALLGVQAASAAVTSHLNPGEALQEIAEKAFRVIGGDAAAIFLVDASKNCLEPRAVAGDVTGDALRTMPRLPAGTSRWKAFRESEGLLVGDAQTDPDLAGNRTYLHRQGVKSLLAVPLIARGKAIGLLGVVNRRRKHAFRREDLRVIRLFAEQAAVALDNSRLYAEAKYASARLSAQIRLGKTMFQGIRDPVALTNGEGRIVSGNRALFAALGREPGQVIGHRWYEFVEPADAKALGARARAAPSGVIRATIHLVRPDGSRIPLMLSVGQVKDPSGRLVGAAVVGVDFEEQRRMEGKLETRERMLHEIARLTRGAGKTLDTRRLAKRALESARRVLGVGTAALYLVEGGDFVLAAGRGLSPEYLAVGSRIAMQGSVSVRALESGRPLVFVDLRRTSRLAPALRSALPDQIRSAAIIPIIREGHDIGVLNFGAADPTPFSPAAINAVKVLAGQFGAAMENARLYEAVRQRAERLATLNKAAEDLSCVAEPVEVVPIVCRALARILGARRVLGLEYDWKKEVLVAIGSYRIAKSRLRRLRPIRLREAPLLALAAGERQPMLSEEVAKTKALPAEYCEMLGYRAAVAVPVISRRALFGILIADNANQPIAPSQDEKDTAMALANQTAITLDNTILLRAEQLRSRQLSVAMQEAHHRIKNNLQAVCDLLELELMELGGADGAACIERSIQRVRAISLVHEFLSRHHDVATVDAGQVLRRLVPLVVASNTKGDQKVEARVKTGAVTLGSRATTSVALIVNELVSNAVRHGLNDGKAGVVEVTLRERNGSVCLRVADNGIGLPEGFDPRTGAHVGLEMSRVLAERDLAGTFAVESRGGRRRGTVAQVRFPG
jgi:PAS domain S-box-containing protein